jgi:nucleolar protein 14
MFFLAPVCRDAERKRKVKELFGSLATQEGEWKALKRRKNSRH